MFPENGPFPSIPQEDVSPKRRAAGIADDIATYQWDYSYHGLPFVKSYEELPLSDRVLPRYDVKEQFLKGMLITNFAAEKAVSFVDAPKGEDKRFFTARKVADALTTWLEKKPAFGDYNKPDPTTANALDREPDAYRDFVHQFRLILPPKIHLHWDGKNPVELSDREFANQRVSGVNPILIERVRDGLPDFPVTDAHMRRALEAQGIASTSFAAAMAEGRLYLSDWSILDGLPCTKPKGKLLKQYLWAPKALFYREPRSGGPEPLVPIAVQLAPTPEGAAIYTPVDAASDPTGHLKWKMAKLAVQIADCNHHGMVMHNAQCHLMMARIVMSTRRTLADNHPVRVLLEPHFDGTMKVVNVGTRNLVEPGGFTPLLQSVNLEGLFELLQRSFDEHDWNYFNPDDCYERRGVAGEELEYPFRDDQRLILKRIRTFVTDYLHLYYHEEKLVQGDVELRAWAQELQSEDGGRIAGIGDHRVDNVPALAAFITQIIDRATTLHAAINYSVFEFMGFAPNMPAAGYAPGPDAIANPTRDDLMRMLPPLDQAKLQIGDTYFVQNMLLDALGQYPRRAFADPRAWGLIEDLQRDLGDYELLIGQANATRVAPYEVLYPSRVGQSILV